MSLEAPRDRMLIIDDLGFRTVWLEKTLQMNIKRLQQIVDRNHATPESLRQTAKELAEDTARSLTELQVCAVERLVVQQSEPAQVLAFEPRGGDARADLVPA